MFCFFLDVVVFWYFIEFWIFKFFGLFFKMDLDCFWGCCWIFFDYVLFLIVVFFWFVVFFFEF